MSGGINEMLGSIYPFDLTVEDSYRDVCALIVRTFQVPIVLVSLNATHINFYPSKIHSEAQEESLATDGQEALPIGAEAQVPLAANFLAAHADEHSLLSDRLNEGKDYAQYSEGETRWFHRDREKDETNSITKIEGQNIDLEDLAELNCGPDVDSAASCDSRMIDLFGHRVIYIKDLDTEARLNEEMRKHIADLYSHAMENRLDEQSTENRFDEESTENRFDEESKENRFDEESKGNRFHEESISEATNSAADSPLLRLPQKHSSLSCPAAINQNWSDSCSSKYSDFHFMDHVQPANRDFSRPRTYCSIPIYLEERVNKAVGSTDAADAIEYDAAGESKNSVSARISKTRVGKLVLMDVAPRRDLVTDPGSLSVLVNFSQIIGPMLRRSQLQIKHFGMFHSMSFVVTMHQQDSEQGSQMNGGVDSQVQGYKGVDSQIQGYHGVDSQIQGYQGVDSQIGSQIMGRDFGSQILVQGTLLQDIEDIKEDIEQRPSKQGPQKTDIKEDTGMDHIETDTHTDSKGDSQDTQNLGLSKESKNTVNKAKNTGDKTDGPKTDVPVHHKSDVPVDYKKDFPSRYAAGTTDVPVASIGTLVNKVPVVNKVPGILNSEVNVGSFEIEYSNLHGKREVEKLTTNESFKLGQILEFPREGFNGVVSMTELRRGLVVRPAILRSTGKQVLCFIYPALSFFQAHCTSSSVSTGATEVIRSYVVVKEVDR